MTIQADDYTFMENADYPDQHLIRIKTGIYKDVIYAYGKVKAVLENNSDDIAKLDFKYQIVENPTDMELDNDPDFGNYIGAVLQHCMTEAFESGKYRIGDGNKHTNDNSKKPN